MRSPAETGTGGRARIGISSAVGRLGALALVVVVIAGVADRLRGDAPEASTLPAGARADLGGADGGGAPAVADALEATPNVEGLEPPCWSEPAGPITLAGDRGIGHGRRGPATRPDAALVADYRFRDSLASSVGTAPDLAQIGDDLTSFVHDAVPGGTSTAYRFAFGSGLRLAPTPGVDDGGFTVEILFRFDVVEGWRKILDLEAGTDDRGLYSKDGCLSFFDAAQGLRATIGTDYAHVVLTRDASGTVAGYVDGVRQFAFHDSGRLALAEIGDPVRFFRDDEVTRSESSGGAVARIRLYDAPLTAHEVAKIACVELSRATCHPTREEYVAEVEAVCGAATDAFATATRGLGGSHPRPWSEAAIRFSDLALAELRSLPPPRGVDHASLDRAYALLEQPVDVLRRIVAVASAGDTDRVAGLMRERIDATHLKDRLVSEHPWLGGSLQRCPVALPA